MPNNQEMRLPAMVGVFLWLDFECDRHCLKNDLQICNVTVKQQLGLLAFAKQASDVYLTLS